MSLLDLNVETQHHDSKAPPLEILEAGTGHASLTIHLARAIHAANQSTDDDHGLQPLDDLTDSPSRGLQSHRQAVVHTVDISASTSRHAQQIVSGFRQGMYCKDIDFHVGDVSEWIRQQLAIRGLTESETDEDEANTVEPFLTHIVLDMPNADHHIELAISALHVNGGLLVFNPSITQIMTVVRIVTEKFLPLQLERVLELGQHMTGGKEWDVRCVKPRARVQSEGSAVGEAAAASNANQEEPEERTEEGEGEAANHTGTSRTKPDPDAGWAMVGRPKVGYRIVGGGFVAFFRKMKK